MKILDDIYAVGGGKYGIGISSELDCNVYLIDGGEELALIDAGVGAETERIIENVVKESLNKTKISKLILTHAHLDHAGGTARLKEILNLEVYISEKEAVYLETGDEYAIGLVAAKKSGIYPKDYKLHPVKVDHCLNGGESIKVGKYNLRVIPTPGHSKGSICLSLIGNGKRILFSGDTIFMGGLICLLNLPDSSLGDYKEGIKNLENLSVDSLIPSHYGFSLNYGQLHINMAADALLNNIAVPKMIE
jgi:glyoxylase-like metal-dependent hydrolase (beta-lactamase superfamily II)